VLFRSGNKPGLSFRSPEAKVPGDPTLDKASKDDFSKYLQDDVIAPILKKHQIIHDVNALLGLEKGKVEKPFVFFSHEGKDYVPLPPNSEKLAENYLFRLYLATLQQDGKIGVRLEKGETYLKLALDQRNLTFLQSFGVVLTAEEYAPLPKNKGIVFKGMICAYKQILSGMKNVDLSLFKVNSAPHIFTQLFGDVWAKGYDVEKQLLDYILNYLRSRKKIKVNWSNLLIDKQLIMRQSGLILDLSNELLNDAERTIIRICVDETKIDFDVDPGYDLVDQNKILSYQKDLDEKRKALKPIKDLVSSMVNSRVQAAFAPYTGKRREKVKKTRITELVNQIKGTSHYYAFNPTRVLTLLGGAKRSDIPPSSKEKLEKNFGRN